MKNVVRFSVAFAIALSAAPAYAQGDMEYGKDNWPMAKNDRPLTLAKGMLEIAGDTLRVNLSSDLVGDPIMIAPSIHYGVSQKLSVGVTHERGLCIAGDLCDKAYNDVGIEALYGLMLSGNFQVAARGGLTFPQFDPDFAAGLNLGLLVRLRTGKIAIVVDPRLYVGVLKRDEVAKELIDTRVHIRYQASNQLNAFLRTGLQGPLKDLGDFYQVPVGLGIDYTINNRLDVGAEFLFANLGGKVPDGVGRADARWLILRAALRL